MLKQITLQNFQSHKDSTLKLDKRINAIVGISDSGKTAILRALYQTRYNQGSFDPFVSKWARNEKGNQTEQTNIIIKKGNQILTRGKGKDLNGYDLNGSIFEALGKSGLPEEIETFFNTTEVNIQKQMDIPFLIGNRPSEIASFLNTVVDMQDIDLYLSAIDSKKRNVNRDIKRITNEIENSKKEKDRFHELSTVNIKIKRMDVIKKKIDFKVTTEDTLLQLIKDYDSYSKKMVSMKHIKEIKANISKIETIKNKFSTKEEDIHNLKEIIDFHKKQESILDNIIDVDSLNKNLDKMEKHEANIIIIKNKIKSLKTACEIYNSSKDILLNTKDIIEELKSKLPNVCPTCGQKWENK